jgi:hypothetical protein
MTRRVAFGFGSFTHQLAAALERIPSQLEPPQEQGAPPGGPREAPEKSSELRQG